MSSENGAILIRNRRICEYYERNPHVDVEAVNLVVLDLFEALGKDLAASLTNAKLGELVQSVAELRTGLPARLHESNQMFLESVKLIVGMSTGENTERVIAALQRSADGYVDQLKLHMPKLSGAEEVLAAVRGELQRHMAAGAEASAQSLEAKVISTLQPLYTFVSSNQDQLSTKLDGLREDVGTGRTSTDRMSAELGEFLSKYGASSQFKGQCSENRLSSLLSETWPTAEVQNATALKASGDFIMRRAGCDDVMFENKNYEANVDISETKKFIRDANELGTHAVLLSQRSGVASKPNFFVELNGSKVLVYVHHVDYSAEKVKMAVDLIDALALRLRELSLLQQQQGGGGEGVEGGGSAGDECTVITLEVLGNIQAEYQRFVQGKEAAVQQVRDFSKTMLARIEEMRLPELSGLLNKKFASASNEQHLCPVCKLPFGTKRALASHLKKHKDWGLGGLGGSAPQ